MPDIDRTVLPVAMPTHHEPDPPLDVRQARPGTAMAQRPLPPAGAPNILVILLDDVGFGAGSPYGGPCRMPVAQQLADGGLTYTRFHTTGLCAPTRTALLTGRNHHVCGMGAVPEMATPYPGYDATRRREHTTVAQILQANGYATAAFGKMHQTPPWEQTPAGPFEHWPTNEGFDHFYGFLGAETNQYAPSLFEGTTPVNPSIDDDPDYHLSADLADRAISWIEAVRTFDHLRPWFCYLSFGACHTPFHVPEAWRDRYRGEFDHGWDEQRARTVERQRAVGVVPPDAELAPWTPGVPHWHELGAAEQRVAARMMELYAAFLEHTDAQVGRVVESLRQAGALDDTVVLYLIGDNGASAEGGLDGTLNEMLTVNGIPDSAARIEEQLDELGGPTTYPLYPAGWAVAMNTPYQWTKQLASHYGGTRNGMIVHWPAGIPAGPQVRHQWHHCIDIAPTLLDLAGVPEPTVVNGVEQVPMNGVSMRYTFDDARAPDRHTVQYFEIFGNRGIYQDGWMASTAHRVPWKPAAASWPRFEDDVWELYHVDEDWTQARDVAGQFPDKLRQMQELFLDEARKYDVLPLDDRLAERMNAQMAGRRTPLADRRTVTLRHGAARLREDAVPNVKNTSFRVTAEVVVDADASGVLVAQGGRFGGWCIYAVDGVVSFCHNLCGLERYHVRSGRALPGGTRLVEMAFTYDGGGVGKGGTASLSIDGECVGQGRVERTVPYAFSVDETLTVGFDRGTPVTEEYGTGQRSRFSGTIRWLRIDSLDDGDAAGSEGTLRAAVMTQ